MWALFTEDELHEAVKRTLGEEKLTAVVASSHVSRSTLKRALVARKRGDSLERKRPGPKPLLPAKCEEDLVTWIAAMQRTMFPVHPWELLEIANELNRSIRGNLRSVTDLTYGWYARFSNRHPVFNLCAAESLSRARQGVDEHAFHQLFYSICQPMIQHNLDEARIFNMNKTSFVGKHTSKAVVAVRGSFNV